MMYNKEKEGFPWEVTNSSCSSQNLEAWTHPTLKPVLGLHRSHLELLVQLIHLFRKEPVFKPYLGVSTLPRYIISPKCLHSAKRQSLSKSHRNSRQQLSASSWEVGILRDTKQVCGRLTSWVTDSDEGEADWKQTDSLRMQSTVLFKIRCIVMVTEWRLVNFCQIIIIQKNVKDMQK